MPWMSLSTTTPTLATVLHRVPGRAMAMSTITTARRMP